MRRVGRFVGLCSFGAVFAAWDFYARSPLSGVLALPIVVGGVLLVRDSG
jgi:hypothetical protein